MTPMIPLGAHSSPIIIGSEGQYTESLGIFLSISKSKTHSAFIILVTWIFFSFDAL